jgi:hypothetical protein
VSDLPLNDQVNELCAEVLTLRAHITELKAALQGMLRYYVVPYGGAGYASYGPGEREVINAAYDAINRKTTP